VFIPGFVNSDQLAQKLKYEHQTSIPRGGLENYLEREVDSRNWM